MHDDNDEAETDSRNEVSEGVSGKGGENEGLMLKVKRMKESVIKVKRMYVQVF